MGRNSLLMIETMILVVVIVLYRAKETSGIVIAIILT